MRSRGVSIALGPEALATVLSLIVLGLLFGPLPDLVPAGAPDPGATGPPASPTPTPATTEGAAGRDAAIALALQTNAEIIRMVTLIEGQLALKPPDVASMREVLPVLNTQLAFARSGAAGQLERYASTVAVRAQMEGTYKFIVDTIRQALSVAAANVTAQIERGTEIVDRLEELAAITEALQALLQAEVLPSPAASPSPSGSPSPSIGPSPSISPSPSVGPSTSPSGPIASPAPLGMLVNPGFEDGVDFPWQLQLRDPALATHASDTLIFVGGARSARIDITAGTERRTAIIFYQDGLRLKAGQRYQVSLSVRASASRDLRVTIVGRNGLGVPVTTDALNALPVWANQTFSFSVFSDDDGARFQVELGASDATVWLDDVIVQPITELPVPSPSPSPTP